MGGVDLKNKKPQKVHLRPILNLHTEWLAGGGSKYVENKFKKWEKLIKNYIFVGGWEGVQWDR